jgi:hypothetical protein
MLRYVLEHGNLPSLLTEPQPPKVYGPLSMIAVAVSLMATWEALCSTMGAALISGGPVSLVWGFVGQFELRAMSCATLTENISILGWKYIDEYVSRRSSCNVSLVPVTRLLDLY